MRLFTIFALSLAVIQPAYSADPPVTPAPPSIADVLKAREVVTAALKKEAEVTAAFNRELAKLGAKPVDPFLVGIGKPGKDGAPGKDGHSPVIKWGTGVDFDRLMIDGVGGPHLTGPQGIQGPPGGVPVPPPPPPQPVTKAAWAIVFEETANRTPATARVLGDTAAWNALGVQWRHIDKDDPYAQKPASKASIDQAGGLPCLVVMDENLKVIKAVKLPATMAEVAKAVKP